jgi:hydrogenase-4 component B
VPGGWRAAAYLLALTGFGFKAGLVPLHVWLPEAHPVAPADGSAFLSGLVVKLGIYGIALFAFRLAPAGGAWPGLVTMGIGAPPPPSASCTRCGNVTSSGSWPTRRSRTPGSS